MSANEAWEEYMARNLQDPEYAAAHAVGRPFHNLCLNVWSLRETRGITQQQLAEAAQMKQPRIADIERDAANPTLQTISRIAFALGVTADRLLAEPDEAVLAEARGVVEARIATLSPARRRRLGLLDDTEPQTEITGTPKRRRKTA